MSTTIQQVPAGTFAVDSVHSTIGFGVRHNRLATFRSTFEKFDAQLVDGVLTGTTDVTSIQIDEPNLKGHLLSEEFFNVAVATTIGFRSTEIRLSEDGGAEVDGELTIRDVTKPVTVTGTTPPAPMRSATSGSRSSSRRLSTAASTAWTGRTRCPTAPTRWPGTSRSRSTCS